MNDIIEKSRQLMYEQTLKNGNPPLALTDLAVQKGRELAKKYKANEDLVVISLYLAHTVFDQERKSEIQKNHPALSAEFDKKYLEQWGVDEKDQKIILNAIQAHHAKVPIESLEAEIMKNAECYKFVTLKGCLIFLHDLGNRQMTFKESVEYVLYKMNQKLKLLTFDDCKKEAEVNCKKIRELFNSIK